MYSDRRLCSSSRGEQQGALNFFFVRKEKKTEFGMSRSVLIVPLSVFFQMKKLARRQQQQQEQQNSQRLGQGTVSQYEPHCKLFFQDLCNLTI